VIFLPRDFLVAIISTTYDSSISATTRDGCSDGKRLHLDDARAFVEESTEDSMLFDFVWLDGGTKLVETGRNVDIREGEPKEEMCAVLYIIYTQYI